MNAKLLNVEPSTPEENKIITMNTPAEAIDIQKKLNKNIQPNKVITRRGSTVSKASRRPTRKETINKVTDIAIESIRDHREHILESEMDDDEIDEYILFKKISLKLVGNTVPKPTNIYIYIYIYHVYISHVSCIYIYIYIYLYIYISIYI